jgi:GLPGLI family protein
MTTSVFKHFLLCCFLSGIMSTISAQVTSGKIVYERKTNLYKKFKGDDVKEWLREEDKNKVDVFELYFNDSVSLFKPQESELRERMSWATDKNIVYQNLNTNRRLTVKDVWGEKIYIEDTLWRRQWKITDSKRVIAGYSCRKAIWQADDTTRIYAWYTEELMTSTGPESFNGLPGTILGLATEDGGVIYFAKTVEVSKQNPAAQAPAKGKNKIYTTAEIKAKLEKDFSKNPWGRQMLKNLFGLW